MTRATGWALLALGCVVVVIAAFDVRARSSAPPTTAAHVQSSSPHPAAAAPEVQRGLDKTPLVYPAQFIDQLVQRSRDAFVLARDDASGEAVAGVVIGPREALIASPRDAAWTLATADGANRKAVRRASDPVHGLGLLTLAQDSAAFLTFGPPALTSGSPVVAVRPTRTALVTQLIPAPGTEASLAVRLAGSQLAPGTAVIDLDGRLVAFFGAGVMGGIPLVANELDTGILPSLRNGETPAIPWLGADLQAIDAALAPVVGKGLAVVTWVDPSSPAGGAGLQARDTIQAVRADGRPIATLDALTAALRPGVELSLDVRQGARTRTVRVVVGRRAYPPGVDAATGVAVESGEAPVLRVAPASPLARAGLRTGDIVEAVNGRAVKAMDLDRTLRRAGGIVLTVRRDGQRRLVVLPADEAAGGRGA
jgi:S1-C subfamily serine protease